MFNKYCNICYHYIGHTCTSASDCANNEYCNDHDSDPGTARICAGKINVYFH